MSEIRHALLSGIALLRVIWLAFWGIVLLIAYLAMRMAGVNAIEIAREGY